MTSEDTRCTAIILTGCQKITSPIWGNLSSDDLIGRFFGDLAGDLVGICCRGDPIVGFLGDFPLDCLELCTATKLEFFMSIAMTPRREIFE